MAEPHSFRQLSDFLIFLFFNSPQEKHVSATLWELNIAVTTWAHGFFRTLIGTEYQRSPLVIGYALFRSSIQLKRRQPIARNRAR